MRVKTINITERDLMFTIAGQLYAQAPNRQPRKADVIMQKVQDAFRKEAYNNNEWYCLEIPEKNTYQYIKDLMMAIPEFVELNLSMVEYEKNISVDDESRPKYAFTTRYDKHGPDSWKTDFIDLDAFIGNAHNRLMWVRESDQDCFCCKYEGLKPADICGTCSVNPNLKYKFEGTRKPKGEHKFACAFNCHAHYYICCEECKKKESCPNKCDGNSETCGNKVTE